MFKYLDPKVSATCLQRHPRAAPNECAFPWMTLERLGTGKTRSETAGIPLLGSSMSGDDHAIVVEASVADVPVYRWRDSRLYDIDNDHDVEDCSRQPSFGQANPRGPV